MEYKNTKPSYKEFKSRSITQLTKPSILPWPSISPDKGVVHPDLSIRIEMLSSTPPDYCYDYTTGYLEDALVEFSYRFKRQRLFPQDSAFHDNSSAFPSGSDPFYWTEANCAPRKSLKFPSPTKSIIHSDESSCGFSIESSSASDGGGRGEMKASSTKTSWPRVAYPFATVKPGGKEGDLTLDDINKRIMMPPTRPVRHPVGEYACRPCVASPRGPGLSGRAIVALTRIQTQGRGSITIIRTKG